MMKTYVILEYHVMVHGKKEVFSSLFGAVTVISVDTGMLRLQGVLCVHHGRAKRAQMHTRSL